MTDRAVTVTETGFISLLRLAAAVANDSASFDEALSRCLGPICESLGWSVGHVYRRPIRHADGPLRSPRIWWVDDDDRYRPFMALAESMELEPGVGLPGRVLETGRSIWLKHGEPMSGLPRREVANECGIRSALAVPVLSGQAVVAVLELFSTERREEDAEQIAVVEDIGIQLGRVIERERTTELLRSQHRIQATLAATRAAFAEGDESLDAALEVAAGSVMGGLGLLGVEVWLQPGRDDMLERAAAVGLERTPPAMFVEGDPDAAIHEAAASLEARWCDIEVGAEVARLLALPICVEGARLGVLVLFSSGPIEPDDVPLLSEVAGAYAAGIDRWRVGEALVKSEAWFRSVVERGSDLVLVVDAHGEVVYASPSYHRILGYDEESIVGRHTLDLVHPDDRDVATARLDAMIRNEPDSHPLIVRVVDAKGRWRQVRVAAANLLDDPAVRGLLINAVDVTHVRSVEAQLEHERAHDPLTGLPNRQQFVLETTRALQRALRNKWRTALLCVDLDGFRTLNEQFGHEIGDWVLVEVGRRLRRTLRTYDSVARGDGRSRALAARLDGDEFLLLCENMRDESDISSLLARLFESLSLPIVVGDAEVVVSCSIGVYFTSLGEVDVDVSLARAESAMKAAKLEGGARPSLWSPNEATPPPVARTFGGRAQDWRETREDCARPGDRELARAVPEGQLRLHFQPKVSLTTGRVVGVESLVRWEHPERGLLGPGEFIEDAERTGLIVELGSWVLGEACAVGRAWAERAGDEGFLVSVNVSPYQFDPGFRTVVDEALAASGLPARNLCLEITETLLLRDIEGASRLLAGFRAMGVRVAIDDFGTGYSSLAYLKRLPIEELKIDRSFVAGLGVDESATAIVAAVMAMAHALGEVVVAEGIETEDQMIRLQDMGCDIGQGFLFSRPLPASELDAFLRSHASEGVAVPGGPRWLAGSGMPIVVVADDSPVLRQLASVSLSAGGFTVFEASNGLEALELADRVAASCFILDIQMDGLDGFETCRQLRRQPGGHQRTIIMVTSQSSADDKAKAFGLGADDYLVKPFAPRDLLARVRTACARKVALGQG